MLAIKLLLVALVTWALCAAYTLWLNPEIRFFNQLAAVQDAWSREMDREHGHKVVVFGGSSCTFSVVGEQMLEHYNLPVVNRGLAAGLGVKIITLNALEGLRSGDTLVMALEPGLFSGPSELTSFASQFSYVRGHPDWVTCTALGLPGSGWSSSMLMLRPGGYHVVTMIGKIVQGRALYRYRVADAWPSGWMQTGVRIPLKGPPGYGPVLSDDARNFLSALKAWCVAKGVRVAYSLPWGYTPSDQVEGFREKNADLLLQIADYIPVLKDLRLGADQDSGHFADTAWHLNDEGSRLRTEALGRAVTQWELWSVKELQEMRGSYIRPVFRN